MLTQSYPKTAFFTSFSICSNIFKFGYLLTNAPLFPYHKAQRKANDSAIVVLTPLDEILDDVTLADAALVTWVHPPAASGFFNQGL